MSKRAFACLAALLLCALLSGATAEGIAVRPSDSSLLSLLYPGRPIEALSDFCYAVDPPSDGGGDTRTAYKVRETQSFDGYLLVVVESFGGAHSEGLHNHTFAVVDLGAGALVGSPLSFQADAGDYRLGFREGILSVLYVGSTTYQGYESCYGGRWEWDGGDWRFLWPDEGTGYATDAYYEQWQDRKAVIADPFFPDYVQMYRRVTDGPSDSVMPAWRWEMDWSWPVVPSVSR